MKKLLIVFTALLVLPCMAFAIPVPDTGQTKCYGNTQEIPCPQPGQPFYGQDAQYGSNTKFYTKLDANGDDLPFSATEGDLKGLFSEYGVVESAAIITDRETGRSRGFGFVELGADARAQDAIRDIDGTDLQGRNIKVNEAKPRT